MALSSTAFVLQILNEQKLLSSRYGRTSLAILLMQDLAVVPLLALIPLLTTPELSVGEDIGLALAESLLILLLLVLIARHLLHPILYRVVLSGNPEVFTASAVLIVLGTALATEHAGLSMAMGAFLAGLLISDSFYRHQVLAEIQPFRGLLLGLFFMSMGMSVNLNLLVESPIFTILLVGLLILLKIIVLLPLTYLFKLNFKISLAVALILAQSGEFALVLFSLAHQSTLLTDELFQLILLVVLLSMMATPVLAQLAQRLIIKQGETEVANEEEPVEAPIILAGFGRVGHRIGEILTLANQPFVALDLDADIVEREQSRGHPVFFGDVRKPDILKAVGSDHAQAIIVTLNDPKATNDVVASLRNIHPEIKIFARGHNMEQCRNLHRLGTFGVVSENYEASMELARLVMTSIGFNEEKRDEILHGFRQAYYSRINDSDSAQQTGENRQ
jgi:voltage-gated potassium channel Kch